MPVRKIVEGRFSVLVGRKRAAHDVSARSMLRLRAAPLRGLR